MQFIECVLGAETDSIPLYLLYSLYTMFLYLNIFFLGGESIYTGLFFLLSSLDYQEDKKITSVLNLQKKIFIVSLEIERDYFEGTMMKNSLVYKRTAGSKLCFWKME